MMGVLKISVDGRRLTDDLGASGRLFSGYLFACIGRIQRRERLADMFWGQLEPERARAALNTALWRLRKILACEPRSNGGQNLYSNGAEIVLEPAEWLIVDVHRFTNTLKDLLDPKSTANANSRPTLLESAIEDYAGPFLDGEDADWILEERERLHSLYVRAASELLRHYGSSDRLDDAISVARNILAADPFREAIFRSLMVLYVLNGQRAGALRHYERWQALFRSELDIAPMPQTLRLIDDIRSDQIFERLDELKSQCFQRSNENPAVIADRRRPLAV
jgi:DNA-binding SARP family transcriptional activator